MASPAATTAATFAAANTAMLTATHLNQTHLERMFRFRDLRNECRRALRQRRPAADHGTRGAQRRRPSRALQRARPQGGRDLDEQPGERRGAEEGEPTRGDRAARDAPGDRDHERRRAVLRHDLPERARRLHARRWRVARGPRGLAAGRATRDADEPPDRAGPASSRGTSASAWRMPRPRTKASGSPMSASASGRASTWRTPRTPRRPTCRSASTSPGATTPATATTTIASCSTSAPSAAWRTCSVRSTGRLAAGRHGRASAPAAASPHRCRPPPKPRDAFTDQTAIAMADEGEASADRTSASGLA